MGKRELIALLNVSSWCLVMVERLFLAVPRGCPQFVIVVFPDHTHLLFLHRVCALCGISSRFSLFAKLPVYVIVILWVVRLYVEIIHELKRVDSLTYR